MKKAFRTLDQYLDALDHIKEQVADETAEMDAKHVQAYFAKARERLEELTGRKLRVRRTPVGRRSLKRSQWLRDRSSETSDRHIGIPARFPVPV